MITRAQAEALLTLAEALEACERVGLSFPTGDDEIFIELGDFNWHALGQINAMSIRLALSELVPKSIGS